MLFNYTCINFSNVSCRIELEITVSVAFILCGLSLNFLLFCTFVPGCEFWFCIAMLHACNRCYWALRQCFPIYCTFFPSLIYCVVFHHRPIFQRKNWPQNSPNLVFFFTRLFSASIRHFERVSSDHDWNYLVRLFQSWSELSMHYLLRTLFRAKRVSLVIRFIMFRSSENTALFCLFYHLKVKVSLFQALSQWDDRRKTRTGDERDTGEKKRGQDLSFSLPDHVRAWNRLRCSMIWL